MEEGARRCEEAVVRREAQAAQQGAFAGHRGAGQSQGSVRRGRGINPVARSSLCS